MREEDRRNEQNHCFVPCRGLGVWLLCCTLLCWRRLNYYWTQPLGFVISPWTKCCHPENHRARNMVIFLVGGARLASDDWSSACGSVQANRGALCLTDGKIWLEQMNESIHKHLVYVCMFLGDFRREFVCMYGGVGFDLIRITNAISYWDLLYKFSLGMKLWGNRLNKLWQRWCYWLHRTFHKKRWCSISYNIIYLKNMPT